MFLSFRFAAQISVNFYVNLLVSKGILPVFFHFFEKSNNALRRHLTL